MASTTQVEKRLQALIARLDAGDPEVRQALRESLPEPRTLWLHLSDLSADYWTELDGDGMRELRAGTPEHADIRITADSDDLLDVIDGRSRLFPAYLSGKLRLDASFGDIVRLRRILA